MKQSFQFRPNSLHITLGYKLDHYVRRGLNQDRPDSKSDDGCDAAVLRIDRDKQTIEFAGAKLGLFQVTAEADKPVLQKITYQSGDVFAVVTDGFTDHIGGSTGKTSFGYRRAAVWRQSGSQSYFL